MISLVPESPGIERVANNANGNGLHRFADFLASGGDEVLGDVFLEVSEIAGKVHWISKAAHFVGRILVALGERLAGNFERSQVSRHDKTESIMRQLQASAERKSET
jgi:hypothetical protein